MIGWLRSLLPSASKAQSRKRKRRRNGYFAQARINDILTPYADAIEEVARRRADSALVKKVEAYLNDDFPDYFKGEPVLYLARHLATPNFETLRFLHLVESLPMKPVIGQDTKDKFVPHNPLKKALGKLPICVGMSQKNGIVNEQYRKVSIIDFNKANGKPLESIRTHWGEPLVDFHTSLFKKFISYPIRIEDDAPWIDRCHRGDLGAHYRSFLALFIAHGILFEDYLPENREERKFLKKVLRPAFTHVEREFGLRPLIVQLTPTEMESEAFWESYPREVLEVVKEKFTIKAS